MLVFSLILVLLLFTFCLLVFSLRNQQRRTPSATNLSQNNQKYTIIVSASPVPSHPDLICIKTILKSIFARLSGNLEKIILAHDIIPDDTCNKIRIHACYPKHKREQFKESYPEYMKALRNYLNHNTFKVPIEIIEAEYWGGLTGNINNAMKHVNTKYVMLVQHDLEFVENINVDNIIFDMEKDDEIKLVSFNKDPNSVMLRDPTKTGVLQICHNIGAAPKDQGFGETKVTQTGNSYTRTPCYTDQNHIITTDYWETIIYPQCEEPRFMEHSINKLSPYDSKQFGTFVFGDFKTPKQIHHINCRRAKPILSKKN